MGLCVLITVLTFCRNEMRLPTSLTRAQLSATAMRSADFSHATTWSALSGRAAAATIERVPTPAPTWIVSTPFVGGKEKIAFRRAAAYLDVARPEEPRGGWWVGGAAGARTRSGGARVHVNVNARVYMYMLHAEWGWTCACGVGVHVCVWSGGARVAASARAACEVGVV